MAFDGLFDNFSGLTFAIAIILLVLLITRSLQWPANIPPGPPKYPFIGSMFLLRNKTPHLLFRKLRKQYGDVFSIAIGPKLTVVINGAEALKEAFVKQADVFSDRPISTGSLSRLFHRTKGIGGSSGQHWKLTRTNALSALRDFGFGKRSLESKIQDEVRTFLEVIGQQNGEPFDVNQTTQISICNVICSVAFGSRYEHSDARLQHLVHLTHENLRLTSTVSMIRIMPWLRFLPGDLFDIKKLIRIFLELKAFAQTHLSDHRKSLDEDDPRDFIDVFLTQQGKHEKDDPVFTDDNITVTIINLFVAGTDTTSTVIRWAILLLLHHKTVQDKLRKEIESVVGTARLPSLNDKPNMPYYEAFITETLRVGNIAPLSVPHGATQDINFRGMLIPKGSVILADLDSVMYDADEFENPDEFNPERFLGQEGKLTGKEKTLMAFSLGRRICLGESLARMELFLFLTSLVQRFELIPEDPENLPSLEAVTGLSSSPKDYKFRAIKIE